jgi:PAS domain S-box-containing protein
MAPPDRIEGHIADYLRRDPETAGKITKYDIPGFFKRKRMEEELRRHRDHLEELVKRRTDDLRRSEAKYRGIFENSPEIIVIVDSDGKVADVNRKVTDWLGFHTDGLVGRPFLDLPPIAPASRERLAERFFGKIDFETVPWLEVELTAADGSRSVGRVLGNPIQGGDGTPLGTILMISDITDERRIKEELHKTQKLESLGILAGGIAHDFNNILTAILNNVTLSRLPLDPADEAFEYLKDAEKACLQAKRLTQQLLTFSRGGAPVRDPAPLPELLQETVSFALRGSKSSCAFAIPEDLWLAVVDPGQISQVIHNLVINADQAMPAGGTIHLATENLFVEPGQAFDVKAGRYVRISIRDEGEGIPEEDVPSIFDPYFTTKPKGSGLGLSVCHSIIRQHEGAISLETKPGFGSTFHVLLPAVEEKPAPRPPPETGPPSLSGRVLLMDDEEVILRTTRIMLGRLGCEVVLARSGEEAVAAFREARDAGQPFGVVVLDLTVPGGMGGKEAIRKLQEIDPRVVAVVSSGYSTDPVLSAFREYGFKGVLAKPYTIDELQKALATALAGK